MTHASRARVTRTRHAHAIHRNPTTRLPDEKRVRSLVDAVDEERSNHNRSIRSQTLRDPVLAGAGVGRVQVEAAAAKVPCGGGFDDEAGADAWGRDECMTCKLQTANRKLQLYQQ